MLYKDKSIQLAIKNTKLNSQGQAVVEVNDKWRDETEWDDLFKQMKKEKQAERGN